MKTFRSGLSYSEATNMAAALQDGRGAPQRITMKKLDSGKYAILIGGKMASLWISGKLPTQDDIRYYHSVWRK